MSDIPFDRLDNYPSIVLVRAGHASLDYEMTATEAVAWLAGRDRSDASSVLSPVLAALVSNLNDGWEDEDRQLLKPHLPWLVGTADDGRDRDRAYCILDWLAREVTPACLEQAGLAAAAGALRGLDRIDGPESAAAALEPADAARRAASSARNHADGPGETISATSDSATEAASPGTATLRMAIRAAVWNSWDPVQAGWRIPPAQLRSAPETWVWTAAVVAAMDSTVAVVAAGPERSPVLASLRQSSLDLLSRLV